MPMVKAEGWKMDKDEIIWIKTKDGKERNKEKNVRGKRT